MALTENRQTFKFNHSSAPDYYGEAVGDYKIIQKNFDSRSEENLVDINNVKDEIRINKTNTTNNTTDITDLQSDVTNNSTNITNNSTNITNLQENVQTNQTNITNNADGITNNATDIQNLDNVLKSTDGANYIGISTSTPNSGKTVKEHAEWLKGQIDNAVLGQVPDGSLTDEKLSNEAGQIKDTLNSVKTEVNERSQQQKTYAELKNMVENNLLIAGTQYVLTDYRTKYQQPDTNVIKEMPTEQLVLTATDVNKFDVVCSSLDYPQDIIYYDFNDDTCEDDSTPRNGFILRRIDETKEVNIDCPQDWRTMLWARWTPSDAQYYKDGTLTNYSVWTSGNAELDTLYKAGNALYIAKNTNTPSSSTDANVFSKIYDNTTIALLRTEKTKIADKVELKRGNLQEVKTFGNGCYDIKIAGDAYSLHNNVFYSNCYKNSLDIGCFNNTFGSSCYRDTFGSSCYNNTFGSSCYRDTFGSSCYNNTFGSSCSSNTFASSCSNNTFGSSCYRNTFASSCFDNTFASSCYSNTFGSSCYRNTFASSCSSNTFASSCSSNTFGSGYKHINAKELQGKNISNISLLQNKNITNNIERNNSGNYIYWYLDANNNPVYNQIP